MLHRYKLHETSRAGQVKAGQGRSVDGRASQDGQARIGAGQTRAAQL